MDDLYLFSDNWNHAQIMLNELIHELGQIGLEPSLPKLKVMSESHDSENSFEGRKLFVGNHEVEKVGCMKVLGSQIDVTGRERQAFENRIRGAWLVYDKWAHILESSAPLVNRLRFWRMTVEKTFSGVLKLPEKTRNMLPNLNNTNLHDPENDA